MNFFNTIQASGAQLVQYELMGISDHDKVIEVFNLANCPMAWFQVKAFLPDMNECSLKRVLSSSKKLEMMPNKSDMVVGPSGKMCHKYKLIK
jgi:hypothetical protein